MLFKRKLVADNTAVSAVHLTTRQSLVPNAMGEHDRR